MIPAMDDLKMPSGATTKLQTGVIDGTQTIAKTADVNPTDSETSEPAVNDVFETTTQNTDANKNSYTDTQEQSTVVDIVKESLNNINSLVEDIKKTVEADSSTDVSQTKIDENYKKIEQIAKDTTFNDQSLIKETDRSGESVSLDELKITDIKNLKTDTKQQQTESAITLDNIINNIKSKEKDLDNKQEKLTQSVNKNSLIELKIVPDEQEEETSGENLKNTTVKNIGENPGKSVQAHIKNLDRNLLLAMISLRSA